jgi:hypothetical protein
MSRAAFIRLPGLGLVMPALMGLALAGCSPGSMDSGGGGSAGAANTREDLQTQIACRQRVSEMYDHQNRGEIYAANSSMNSPFSSNYQPGISSRGLAAQYSYGKLESECERDTGTGAERSDTIVPPAAPVKAH